MLKNKNPQRQEALASYENQRPTVTPLVDIYENNNELLLMADLPGVEKEALKINVDNDELSIVASRPLEGAGNLLGCEFRGVDYQRTFGLPSGIDLNKISADLKNGVLYLHLPKSEEIKPRQITIRAG